MSTTASESVPKTQKTKPPERRWAPRFWLGCNFPGLMRLFIANRFAFGWRQLYIAVIDIIISLFNSSLGVLQWLLHGWRAARKKIEQPPIFVIGPWRCGTTLLHELLVLDPRFTSPSNYACFAPNHFLLSEKFADRFLRFLLPTHRPMDDMTVSWQSPQEDEFALCNLGLRSPYWTLAFPNHPPQCRDYLDLEGLTPGEVARWKRVFLQFLHELNHRDPRRIVLKSPPHTCRLPVLNELFPNAIYIHIVRNPFIVYSSMMNMWRRMSEAHGFQTPRFEGLEEFVLEQFAHMHQRLEATRGLIDPSRYYEMRYEDLVADPVGQMRQLYEHLQLGDFAAVEPAIQQYAEAKADYRPGRHKLTPAEWETVRHRWGPAIERFGYTAESAEADGLTTHPTAQA
jgi:hypothetical protein